jgi:hypothetical protein
MVVQHRALKVVSREPRITSLEKRRLEAISDLTKWVRDSVEGRTLGNRSGDLFAPDETEAIKLEDGVVARDGG